MTFSPAIDRLVSAAKADGNAVVEVSTGWTKVREVVHMRDPLSAAVGAQAASDGALRRWAVDPTPHNQGEVGFTDDAEKVSISFPAPDRRP